MRNCSSFENGEFNVVPPRIPCRERQGYCSKRCNDCEICSSFILFVPYLLMNVLRITPAELNLKAVLLNGQSFRWRVFNESYYGVVEGLLFYLKRQDESSIEWRCLGKAARSLNIDPATKLYKYLQLEVSLSELWDDWCAKDAFMNELKAVQDLHGIRILRQEPLETLIAFICSANNNIPRISGMVNKLAKLYGDPIVFDSPSQHDCVLEKYPELAYAFPTLPQLTAVQDELTAVLREQLFGYRANYISETVRKLGKMPSNTLEDLALLPCDEIRKALRGFSGVGPKVAECVALMAMGQNQCVPIDRHVFEITKRYFLPHLKESALTENLNRRLMQFYEEKFGAYAGWAQAVLFNQQLEKFIQDPVATIKFTRAKSVTVAKITKKKVKLVRKSVNSTR